MAQWHWKGDDFGGVGWCSSTHFRSRGPAFKLSVKLIIIIKATEAAGAWPVELKGLLINRAVPSYKIAPLSSALARFADLDFYLKAPASYVRRWIQRVMIMNSELLVLWGIINNYGL